MKPFRSREEMLDAHELMFGEAGRQCAEMVLKYATTLFAVQLDAFNIRVVLAPIELGPYNRHAGYHYGPEGEGAFILGNRHVVRLHKGTFVLVQADRPWLSDDFIVHELTHARQAQLLREHAGEKEWERKRGGVHRDRGWYAAIAEACPKYLGVEFPPSSWPTGPRTRDGTLTEVEATHWPESFRLLIVDDDPRLPKTARAA